jgi:hypothetical protein
MLFGHWGDRSPAAAVDEENGHGVFASVYGVNDPYCLVSWEKQLAKLPFRNGRSAHGESL